MQLDLLNLMTASKEMMPELLSSYCFVNGAMLPLAEIDAMGYDEFSLRSKINMPKKLYRYFPNIENTLDDGTNVNYSLVALKNNTVYMQSPSNFDDVYDSDINIDFMTYQKYRLMEYCRKCGSALDENHTIQEFGDEFIRLIVETYNKYKNLDNLFLKQSKSKIDEMSKEVFLLKLKLALVKDNDLGRVLPKVISEEYSEYIQSLKNTFRVACFTTTPLSQLMWGGSYANCHKGFCVEYTVLPNDEKYHDVYYNLFPLIYCKVRPDVSKLLISRIDNELDKDVLWKIYSQGALRKSIDWMFQNEWRLLLPIDKNNYSEFNVEFFPITKVFLGNRMELSKRKEIIDYCKSKDIPYVGVKRNPNVFEMEECPMSCEQCMRCKG